MLKTRKFFLLWDKHKEAKRITYGNGMPWLEEENKGKSPHELHIVRPVMMYILIITILLVYKSK